MGVVAILAAITFGVTEGVRDTQSRTKAKAELAAMAQALERFKTTYGDYPHVEETSDPANAYSLLKALSGWSELQQDGTMVDLDPQREAFIDTGAMNLPAGQEMPADAAPGEGIHFVDPWGEPYVYIYNAGASTWEKFGYVLLSSGPDGLVALDGADADGLIDQDWRESGDNLDNVYLED